MPGKIIDLLPPEITKRKLSSAGREPAIPVPYSAVPKFAKPDILIPDNFWSNLKQFLTERPVKVRERKDAPFTQTSFGTGVGDNLKDFFSSRPAPKGPVNSKLAVAWGSNFGGFGTRISEEGVTKPKPLVEICGQPILRHIMNRHGRADRLPSAIRWSKTPR